MRRVTSVIRELGIERILSIAIVTALVVEAISGLACMSPQAVREVQSAKTIPEGETAVDVSGGFTWGATGPSTYGIPSVPNADIEVNVRKSYAPNQEVQFPTALSLQMGPGMDLSWSMQFATGVLWKKATVKQTVSGFAVSRPLYDAWLMGFFNGFALEAPFSYTPVIYGGVGGVMISPFTGGYLKYINEKRGKKGIVFRGFVLSVDYHPLVINLAIDGLSVGHVDAFIGGFVGGEMKRTLVQFTYGLSVQRNFGPKIVFGLSWGTLR